MRYVCWLLVAAGACTSIDRVDPAGKSLPSVLVQDAGVQLAALARDATWIDHPVVAGVGPAWQLRAQRIRGYLEPDRLVMVDRSEQSPSWAVEMRLARWGAPGNTEAVGSGAVHVDGPYFESRRPGIHEWVESRDEGLKHGFTLFRSPGPSTVLEFEITGAQVQAMEDGARFWTGRGVVDWRGLQVFDADQRKLPTELHGSGTHLSLVLDTSTARWPVTVDPVWAIPETVITGDLGTAEVGYSVDIDGGSMIVGELDGAPSENNAGGKASVRTRNTNNPGDWAGVADLENVSNPDLGAFGQSVAIGPGVAVVAGAAGDLVNRLQVYDYEGQQWIEADTLGDVPLTNAVGGAVIAMDDDLLAAGFADWTREGTPFDIDGAGAVTIWTRDETTTWTELQTIEGDVAGEGLGTVVDADDSVVVMGAPNIDSARIAQLLADGTLRTVTLTGSDSFGSAVATSADYAAISTPSSDKVEVYYHSSETGWGGKVTLNAPVVAGDRFGASVAMDGTLLAVSDRPDTGMFQVHLYENKGGAWNYVDSIEVGPSNVVAAPLAISSNLLAVGIPGQNAVLTFAITGDTLVEVSNFGAEALVTDGFGARIAIDGDQAAVSAYRDDTIGTNAGMVAMFEYQGGVWSLQTYLENGRPYNSVYYGEAADDLFGYELALVNRQFLVVGAPHRDDTFTDQGAAYVIEFHDDWDAATYGPLLDDVRLTSTEACATCEFGKSVAASASRILIGEPGNDNKKGRSVVYDWSSPVHVVPVAEIGIGDAVNDEMGTVTAVSGEYLLVGSKFAENANGDSDAGQLRSYRWNDSTSKYIEIGRIEGVGVGSNLGSELAVDADTIATVDASDLYVYNLGQALPVMTAPLVDVPSALALDGDLLFVGYMDAATPYVEVRQQNSGGDFDTYDVVQSYTGDAGSQFGSAVAASEGFIAIGAKSTLVSGVDNGWVYFYDWSAEHVPATARGDAFTFSEDTEATTATAVLANDTDANDDVLSVTVGTAPAHDAAFTLASTGLVTYLAQPEYCGDDSFTYKLIDGDAATTDPIATVSLTVQCVNDVPLAGPFHADASETEVVVGSLWDLVDDSADGESDGALHYTVAPKVGTPAGLLTFDAVTGEFTFVSSAAGDFAYTYTVTDNGQAPDDLQAEHNSSELTFHVEHVPPQINRPTTTLSGEEDHQIHLPAPGLVDPDIVSSYFPLTVQIEDNVDHGRVDVGIAGDFHYYPDPNYFGPDTFSYRVSDGFPNGTSDVITLNLTVASVNDLPVGQPDGPHIGHEDVALEISKAALLVNDSDVETAAAGLSVTLDLTQLPTHGTLSENASAITYTPDPDWNGSDLLYYQIGDGEGSSLPIAVSVVFIAENDAPTAQDLLFENVQGPIEGTVVAEDPEGDLVTLVMVGAPSLGKLELEPDGAFVYTPFSGEVGLDSALVQPVDSHGKGGAPALVQFELLPSGGTTDTDTTDTDAPCEPVSYYPDADGDGYGNVEFSQLTCIPLDGWVLDNTDCDDLFADRYPGAREVAGDGVDQDCDGVDNTVAASGGCGCDGTGPSGAWWALGVVFLARRRGGVR